MGNFNRTGSGNRSGGGFSRGGFGGRSGGRDGGRPTMMHRATCSDCGDSCELPFRPTGDRPVFCNSCFGKQDNGGGRSSRDSGGGRSNRFDNDRGDRPRARDKQMHDAICDKCGKDCQVPFRPTGDKPIFCDKCFGKGEAATFGKGENTSKGSNETAEQIKALSAKIDKLMEILAPGSSIKKTEKEKVEKTEKPKAEKKEKNPSTHKASKGTAKAVSKKVSNSSPGSSHKATNLKKATNGTAAKKKK
ncbi:hypothetical protein L6259_01030 [Candidatus Parcubacteria bacterium]|nr:hypothetical protein [Patescibacteria group bacterium]MCG2693856.1 hypothetical protein [Candidatus Parcubacteria bacterium]